MGRRYITQIADYLIANAGRPVSRSELQEKFGYTPQQISGCIQTFKDKGGVADNLEVVVAGAVWVYRHPNGQAEAKPAKPELAPDRPATPAPLMFEHIGQTRSGALIIRDDNGALYTATAM